MNNFLCPRKSMNEFIEFCDKMIISKFDIAIESTQTHEIRFIDYEDVMSYLNGITISSNDMEEHIMKAHGTKEGAIKAHKNDPSINIISWFDEAYDAKKVAKLINKAFSRRKGSLANQVIRCRERPEIIYTFKEPIGYCLDKKGNVQEATSIKVTFILKVKGHAKSINKTRDTIVTIQITSAYPIL